MGRNAVRSTDEASQSAVLTSSWRVLGSWALVGLLGVIAWLSVQAAAALPQLSLATLLSLAALAAIHLGLTVTLESGLAVLPLAHGWRYRVAFAGSALLSILHWGLLASSQPAIPFWLSAAGILASVGGSFAGGLAASGLNEPLWENNSPPSAWIEQEVYRLHKQVIGVPRSTPVFKRCFDLALASLGLLLSAPLWMAVCLLIWIEDPGPLLFVKNSVGRGGMNFRQLKFRTMVRQAETHTGPVLAREGDERVLIFGRLLRKTALDELPQLVNILLGQMSFVGPRPQRTVLVHDYLQRMPEYAQRHQVLPGLAGLAQVAGDYYLTPRQKLRFDRLYIRYTSLGFDLKLIWLAFLIAFKYRWQRDWGGRLPRRLIRFGSPAYKAGGYPDWSAG